jgi:hypothetical protein
MSFSTRAVRDRIVPALLTAAGVTALAAGLLNYVVPAQAGRDGAVASPAIVAPTPGASFILPSLPPIDASLDPGASSSPAADRVATRVVIESLGIDLPVIAPPNDGYPPCNVALYFQDPGLGQPGEGRSVYLYAHARTGMFLPLLTASERDNGSAMLGSGVDVYTSDDLHFLYSITRVIRHVPADTHFLDAPLASTGETLWLQTSEGSTADKPKLQVVAEPVLVGAADHAAAHPKPHPVACG